MTDASRLCIVTGHSRGLGAAMAAQLLQPGTLLIGLARRENTALTALAKQRGAQIEQWSVDLADALPAARRLRETLAGFAPERFERALLINNAGAITEPAPLRDTDLAALATTLRIDLEAATLLCAAFLDATRAWRGQRRVLNISSGLGRRAMAGSALYCAAKAGMDHLSRSLALEEESVPNGARVVSLAPGVIDTDMQVTIRAADQADFPPVERFRKLKADGALGSPAQVAERILAYLDRDDFGEREIDDIREH